VDVMTTQKEYSVRCFRIQIVLRLGTEYYADPKNGYKSKQIDLSAATSGSRDKKITRMIRFFPIFESYFDRNGQI